MNRIVLLAVVVSFIGLFFLGYSKGLIGSSAGSEHQVIMKGGEFAPRSLEISKGDTVTFVNEDEKDRWPASNLHPTHTIYSEFDPLEPVKPGESWRFRFKKEGTWRYHDHLDPLKGGTITVK